MRRAAFIVLIPFALLLSACGTAEPTSPSMPSSTPAADVLAEEPPAPVVTAPARNADSPLEAIDAYAVCAASEIWGRTPSDIEWQPFEEALVTTRDDGAWFVYIKTVVNSPEVSPEPYALSCTLDGTIGDIEWLGNGGRLWKDPSTVNPNTYHLE